MKFIVRLFRGCGLALATILVASKGFAAVTPSAVPVRIMPLGDSLTSGTSSYTVQGGYRNRLHTLLTNAGYNVDFVGTFTDSANPTLADISHQGVGGARIDDIQTGLSGWLGAVQDPDVVLLLIGTNDFWQNYNLATVQTRLTNLIADIANKRPFAKIIVSNLPLRNDFPTVEAQQVAFNSAIPGIVLQQVALGRQVSFVDMHSALTPTDINGDGVHPSTGGFDKMGEAWFPAIASVISPQGTTNPPVISRTGIIDLTHVSVVFSKPVADAAVNLANFTIPGLTVSSAVLDSAKRTVTLTTSAQIPGLVYRLSVSGVRDRTSQQLLIAPGSMANFSPSALTNGSFENDFTGWTATGHCEIRSISPYIASNGTKLAAFNTGELTPNATLSQTFATTVGQAYQLSFDVSILAYNTSVQRLGVAVNGSGNLVSQTVSITGLRNGATPWQNKTYAFVANTTTSTVTFSDLSTTTSGIDLLLDNVQVGAQNTRSLAVTSTSTSGVSMTITPSDSTGLANGTTGLIRSYASGASVTVTAPTTFGAASFLKWQKNGVDLPGVGAGVTLPMDGNYALNAVFGTNNPPVAVADSYSGFSDTQLVVPAIGVLTNDTDPDGGQLTAVLNTPPTRGTLVLNPNGSFTYAPNNGYQGTDSFTYRAYDGVSNSNAVTVSLTINPGTTQLITNGSFESYLASWTFTGSMLMQGAAPYVASNGTLLLALNAGQGTPNGTISQTIPTVPGQTYQLTFDVAVLAYNTSIQRLQAAVDGVGNLLSQTTTVTGVGNGMTPWVTKSYSFTANSATTTVTFRDLSTVTSGIDLLLDNVRVMGSTPSRTLTVSSTPVSVVLVGVSPADRNSDANGITGFTRSYSSGTIVNLTVPPVSGVSSFVKWQQNGADFSNTPSTSVTIAADMTLTAIYGVNTAPVAVAESYSTPMDTALVVAAAGVLANDTDGESNPLTALANAGPSNGTLSLDPNGGFTYNPTAGYAGADSFTYHAYDGSLNSNVVTVNLTVFGGAPSALANGGFEDGESAWTITGNHIVYTSAAPYLPSEGSKFMIFNGGNTSPNAVVSQSFATIPGQSYTLDFDLGILALNTGTQRLRVALTGATSLFSQTEMVTGNGQGNSVWISKSFPFTADSTTTTLTFTDVSTTTIQIDLMLDNIRVSTEGSSPTTHSLTVTSTPASGVSVTVTPSDNNATGNGSTQFVRTYNQGTSVTLTAPATSGTSAFVKWRKNSVDLTNNLSASVTMDADHTLTAVYGAVPPAPTFANGSFEAGETAWTITGNRAVIDSSAPYTAIDGGKLLILNNSNRTPNAVVSQTFSTIPGEAYQLAFHMGILAGNSSQQRLQFSLTGTAALIPTTTESLSGNGQGNAVWTLKSYTFTADSTAATLTFTDVSPTSSGLDLLLDNIKVGLFVPPAAPVAAADSYPANYGSALVVPASGVLGNDTDANLDALTAVLDAGPSNGSLTLNPNGGFTYTHNPSFIGTDSFTYHANDGTQDSNVVTVSIDVTAPEILLNGSFESGEASWTMTGNRTAYDSAAPYLAQDGTKLLILNGGNSAPNAVISQSFATVSGQLYQLTFQMGVLGLNSNEQKMRISIAGAAPLITPAIESIFGNGQGTTIWAAKSYNFTANSSTTTLTFTDVSATTFGLDLLLDRVSVRGPSAGGIPNTPPVAVGETYSTNQNTALVVAANGVLANDTDADLNPLTAIIATGPSHGSVTLNANGGFTYTPTNGYSGSDSFTYQADDGTVDSNVATVTIDVTGTGTAVEILFNGSFEDGETGWSITGNRVAYSSTAPYLAQDGTKLLIMNNANSAPNAVASQSFATVSGQPYQLTFQMGVLGINSNEQKMRINIAGAAPLITPAIESIFGNAQGTTIWAAKSYNFTANSSTTTLTFTDVSATTYGLDLLLDRVSVRGPSAGGIPNTPPVAVGETYSTNQNTALVVAANGVLANDTDADLNPLTAIIGTGPSHGSVTLNANGGFTYTPTNGYSGSDSFTYRANDGLVSSNAATVSITINQTYAGLVNGGFESYFTGWTFTGSLTIESGAAYAPPEGVNVAGFNSANLLPDGVISQTFTTVAGQNYTVAFDLGVLSFGGNTSAQKMQVRANGTASLLSRDVTLTGLGTGINRWAPQSFTFVADSTSTTLSFSDLSSSTQNIDLLLDNVRVILTPSGPNTAPVAVADSYGVNKNTPLVVAAAGVLLNDTDAQSTPLTAVLGTGPSRGTLSLSPYGGFTYTPANNYTGPDSFTYRANDGSSNSSLATVTLNVSQALVANGSFESAFTSWTLSGTLTLESGAAYAATDGVNVAGFNSANTAPNGTVSQTLATVAGQPYTLTFDVGVLSFGGNTNPQKMLVTANGTSNVLSRTITLNGLGGGASVWTPQIFSFIANSASTTLAFTDQSATTSNTDLLLDNVRVTQGVSGPNTAPVAVADTYSTPVNTPLVISAAAGVLGNDSDFHFNPITALLSTGPANGTLTLNANGGFTYLPTTSYTGPDSFTYRANDGSLDSNIVTVTINVNAAGVPVPVTFVNGGFESGFTGWMLSGSLTLESGAAYAPPQGLVVAGFNSANLLSDGVISQSFATVAGQSYTVNFDVGVLSFSGNTGVQKIQVRATGNSSLLGRDITTLAGLGTGASRWAPYTSTFVADSASTTLAFSDLSSATQNIDLLLDNVRVSPTPSGPNTAPVGVADSYSVNKNTALIVAAAGVLSNDSDPQANLLSAVLATGPSHGTLNLSPYGGFTYTPANNYTGTDSFTYRANDGSLDSNLVTVTIAITQPLLVNGSFESNFTGWTVTGTLTIESGAAYAPTQGAIVAGFNSSNTAPNGIISQTFATLAGQAYTLTFDVGVLSFNGNTSPQKMQVNVIGTSSLLSQNITLNGLGGGASIWAPQTFSFLANSASTTLTFGDQSATTSNTDLLLDNVRVFLGVNGPNTAPVAVANTYSTNVSTPLVVAAAGVLTNDTDAQSNPLTALLSTGPANGTLTLNANGGFTYTPTTSYTGPDSFTYRANDGSLDSNIVTVTINVNAVGPVTPVAFVNGSFESGLTGWTIGGSANTVLAKSDIAGTDGTTLAAFNSANTATNGVLSQTFATTPGLLYTVTFDMGVLAYNTSQQRIEVSAAGTGSLLSQIFTLNGINGGNVFWASKTASFTANNTSTTLTFSDRSTTGSGLDLLLDHVRVTSSAPPATGPFANGSFESGFTGWSVSGSANSILLNTVIPAPNGTTLAIFNSANSANNGVVTQTFATTAGTTYTVTFDMGVLAYNTSQQRLEVSAVGTGSLLSQTFARNGIGGGLVTWATQTVSFTANSASTILTFSDRSTTGSGLDLLLDYVRVTSAAAPSSIPAPPSTTAESEDLAAETAVTTVPANPGTLGSMSLNGTPGSFRVGMNAVETGLYILERSEDLKAWNYHSEIQVNEPGPIEFQDNETPSTHMFYRIGRQVEELRN